MADPARPLYRISVVADMLKLHPQTLRLYERRGLVRPSRSEGRTRLYSAEDVDDVRRIVRLSRDLGVNLAGIEIILRMRRQMISMQADLERLAAEGGSEAGGSRSPGVPDREALVRFSERQLRQLDVI